MICYRHAAFATPLRTVPASRPARFSSGGEDEPTQYLALHPLGPLAELMRNADLRTLEQACAVQTRTWALDVPLDGLLELDFDTADRFGITARELVADDCASCQELAGRLRRRRLPGLIVPSASLPGTRNVVLFGPRVAAPYLTEPVSTLDVPASITAEGARPLLALLGIVRFRGEPHPALDARERGSAFEFAEPEWALAR